MVRQRLRGRRVVGVGLGAVWSLSGLMVFALRSARERYRSDTVAPHSELRSLGDGVGMLMGGRRSLPAIQNGKSRLARGRLTRFDTMSLTDHSDRFERKVVSRAQGGSYSTQTGKTNFLVKLSIRYAHAYGECIFLLEGLSKI